MTTEVNRYTKISFYIISKKRNGLFTCQFANLKLHFSASDPIHSTSLSPSFSCSRYWLSCHMTSCFSVCDGSREVCVPDLNNWSELDRGLSWSSAACEFQWDLPVAYLFELSRNHQVVRYFPAHPTPSSFSTSFPPHLHIFLFTLSPISNRCGWTCSPGFQRQRPHIWTSFVAVNPNPALTHESQLHWTNTNSAVSCLLMDNKTIMRDQTGTARLWTKKKRWGVEKWRQHRWGRGGGCLSMDCLDNSLSVSLPSWGWVTGRPLHRVKLHNSNWRHSHLRREKREDIVLCSFTRRERLLSSVLATRCDAGQGAERSEGSIWTSWNWHQ